MRLIGRKLGQEERGNEERRGRDLDDPGRVVFGPADDPQSGVLEQVLLFGPQSVAAVELLDGLDAAIDRGRPRPRLDNHAHLAIEARLVHGRDRTGSKVDQHFIVGAAVAVLGVAGGAEPEDVTGML
jgi:hypothetical protein